MPVASSADRLAYTSSEIDYINSGIYLREMKMIA
jgi:hypothetical protein